MIYPKEINSLIKASSDRDAIRPNAQGRAATFLCGVSVKFDLEIDPARGEIIRVHFATNGCGYVVAAANVIAEALRGAKLVELHALDVLDSSIDRRLKEVPGARRHCINICLDAVQNALADFRRKQIAEWSGDDPLICSCFGVSEAGIESLIRERGFDSVEEIGVECNAGTGCGSCQQLIQELLDDSQSEGTL